MNQQLLEHISYLLCVKIDGVKPISGGDISSVYLLETETERFVCKVNQGVSALRLFQSEKTGLEAIANTKTVATPLVYHCEAIWNDAFLLMEYIESKSPNVSDIERLSHHLAAMHTNGSAIQFGFKSNNFIGSLQQSNTFHDQWSTFYALERLLPQLKLALNQKLLPSGEIPSEELLLERCASLLMDVKPALLHGDLWGGNFLVSTSGIPYLIDPAVYCGHTEVDIAMTRLFGGFSNNFYNAYRRHVPEPRNEKELTDVYQLYYLLVHLNLFGASYYSQVKSILRRYF